MHAFFGKPTRGGKLTIVNCLLWAVVAIGVATDQPLLAWPALVACWPAAWLFILPNLDGGRGSKDDLVVACVAIGLNSVLWGYGLSWLLSLTEKRPRRAGPDNARRGFEVIVESPPERPESR